MVTVPLMETASASSAVSGMGLSSAFGGYWVAGEWGTPETRISRVKKKI